MSRTNIIRVLRFASMLPDSITKAILRRIDIVVAVVVVAILVVRAISSNVIFISRPLSDETYYISSANYIFHLVGIIKNFTPPTPSNNVFISIESTNKTPHIHISVNLTEPAGWIVLFPNIQNIDWLGTGHPILAKLVYGVLANTVGIVGGRFVLLALSAISLFLFVRGVVKRYRLYAVPAVIVFAVLSNVYLHLMYLYFLDTLMMAFLLLAIYFIVREDHSKATIFMALAIASKEIAVLYLVPILVFAMLWRNRGAMVLYALSIVVGLAIGYAPYLLFAPVETFLRDFIRMVSVKDPLACRALCLFDVPEANWGFFKIYTPVFLWIWFVTPLLIRFAERDILPLYFTGIFTILIYAVLSFSRSIYVFYYGYLEPLSVFPMVSIATSILYILKRN